jgi:hypothetical protein
VHAVRDRAERERLAGHRRIQPAGSRARGHVRVGDPRIEVATPTGRRARRRPRLDELVSDPCLALSNAGVVRYRWERHRGRAGVVPLAVSKRHRAGAGLRWGLEILEGDRRSVEDKLVGVQGSATVAGWGPVLGHTLSARAYAGSVESAKRTVGPVATPERAFIEAVGEAARLHRRVVDPKLRSPRVVDQLMAPTTGA